MGRGPFIAAVGLAICVVAALLVASWPDPSPPPPAPPLASPDEPDGGAPMPGQSRSRYGQRSSVWTALERAVGLPDPGADASAAVARELRFTPGLRRERYSEATVAMAISATQGRTVRREEVHGWFCAEADEACRVADYLQPVALTFRVSRPQSPVAATARRAAVEACGGHVAAMLAEWRRRLAAGQGMVVAGFVPDGFPDFDEDTSVHLFAVQAIDGAGALYLKDGADIDPVTYRLNAAKLCEFVVAPTEFRLDDVTPPLAPVWSVRPLFVEREGPPPASLEVTPPPGPTPEDDGLPAAFDGPLPMDMGWFRVPQHGTLLYSVVGRGLPVAPVEFKLRTGVARASSEILGGWLEALEGRWNVRGDGDYYQYAAPQDPLHLAYRHPGEAEVAQVRRLTRHFQAAGARFGKLWILWAIIRFVQEIPYETIPEDPMGLRSPSRVLARHGGDCDSKSLLAAVMLEAAGFDAAVIDLRSAKHAMLAVAASDLAVTPEMATIEAGGRSYVVVETTHPWALGDVAGNTAWQSGHARARVIPVEVPAM